MPCRRALPCLLVVVSALLAACGGTSSGSGSGRAEAWDLPAPYLPPPDPSTLARGRKAKPAAQPSAGTAAATAESPATGAPSDDQVKAELRAAYGGKSGDDLDQAAIDADGLAA